MPFERSLFQANFPLLVDFAKLIGTNGLLILNDNDSIYNLLVVRDNQTQITLEPESLQFFDDFGLSFGADPERYLGALPLERPDISNPLNPGVQSIIKWSTADADNEALVLGLADSNPVLHVSAFDDSNTDWDVDAVDEPQINIHSTTTPATDYITIGNHDGDSASLNIEGGDDFHFQIGGNTEITYDSTSLDLYDNELLNVGNSGGDWTSNNLSIGSGDSVLTSGARVTIQPGVDGTDSVRIATSNGDAFAIFDTTNRDFKIEDASDETIFSVDSSAGTVYVKTLIVGAEDMQSGISFVPGTIVNPPTQASQRDNEIHFQIGGDNRVEITYNAVDILTDELNLNSNDIVNVGNSGGDWTDNYLRIGNNNSVLDAGTSSSHRLDIHTNNTRRLRLTNDTLLSEVDFNLGGDMTIINVGNTGGDWTSNRLSIGSGDSTLTAGGELLIFPTDGVRIRTGATNEDVEILDAGFTKYAYFDTSDRDFVVTNGSDSNVVFRVDSSANDVLVRDAIRGVTDTNTGIHFAGSDVLEFFAGSTSTARMDVRSDEINIYENLNLNTNSVLNVGNTGGDWMSNYLRIGDDNSILDAGISDDDFLYIATNNNIRLTLDQNILLSEVDFDLGGDMTILNVGTDGGDWTANNLSIGSGTSRLTAGGDLQFSAGNDTNDIEFWDSTRRFAFFNSNSHDFHVLSPTDDETLFVDASDGDIYILDGVFGLHDTNTGLHFFTEDILEFYAGTDDHDTQVRFDIRSNVVNSYLDLDMNDNDLLHIGTLFGGNRNATHIDFTNDIMEFYNSDIMGTDALQGLYLTSGTRLFRVDTDDGTTTPLSVEYNISDTVRSIAWSGDTMYAVGSNILYTIDISTGFITRVHATNTLASSMEGLSFHGDILYAISNDDNLYSIDTVNGTSTLVGDVLVSDFLGALASNDVTLYMADRSNDSLYSVNVNTGASTLIGSFNLPGTNPTPRGLAWDRTTDTMYLADARSDSLYTVNLFTGNATRVHPSNTFTTQEARGLSYVEIDVLTPHKRMDIDVDVINIYADLDLNSNDILNVGNSGEWTEDYLKIGDGSAIIQVGDGASDVLTIRVGGDTISDNIIGITTTSILAFEDLNMQNNFILNVGNSGGDWTENNLSIGSGDSTLSAGDNLFINSPENIQIQTDDTTRLTIEDTAVILHVNLDLNGNSITGLVIGDYLPTGGAWTEDYLRIGNGSSILQAGDSTNETLTIRTEGNDAINNRIVISSSEIDFFENLDMNNNTILNVGNAGGDWTSNRLNIGSGDSTLSAGGILSLNTTESLQLQTEGNTRLTVGDIAVTLNVDLDLNGNTIIGLDALGDAFPDGGDWTEDYLRIGNGNSVLQAGDASGETLTVRTEGNTASENRIIVSSSEIGFFENLDMNNNDILNVGNDGGDWTANNLNIGSDNSILGVSGDNSLSIQTNSTNRLVITDVITLHGNLDLNGNTIIGLGDVGDSFPDGGAWTEDYLRIGNGSSILQAGDSVSETLTIRTGGNTEFANRIVISSSEIDFFENLDMNNNDILNVGNSGGDWTGNSLRIGSGASMLSAGGILSLNTTEIIQLQTDSNTRMSIEDNVINVNVDIDLNGNNITGLGMSTGDSFPDGGAWTENYLRIGDGSSILQAGDTFSESLTIRTEGNTIADNRMIISTFEIDFFENLDMNDNDILNVGNSGGDWTTNSLSIGSGDGTLTAGGSLLLDVPADQNIDILENNDMWVRYDSSLRQFVIRDNDTTVFHIDAPDGNIYIQNSILGELNNNVEIHWEDEGIDFLVAPEGVLYAVDNTSHQLFIIDRRTGMATMVHDTNTLMSEEYRSLAYDGTNLYSVSTETDRLYIIDIEESTSSPVHSTNTITGTVEGMAWDGSNMYAVVVEGDLIRINLSNGTSTTVGALGADIISPRGLVWDGEQMYVVDAITQALYTVNLTIGVATRVHSSNTLGISGIQGLTWDGHDMYVVDRSTDTLGIVDRENGTARQYTNTLIADADDIRGIAWVGPILSTRKFNIGEMISSFYEDLDMTTNDLLNVGSSGGDWTTNSLVIGDGDSTISAGGGMVINSTDGLVIRSDTADIEIQNNSSSTYVTFDSSARDFIVSAEFNTVFHVDTSAENILVRNALLGTQDTDTGVHFAGSDVLEFYAGSITSPRMDIRSNDVNMYENLDMNDNDILNVGNSGGDWTDSALRIGNGDVVLRSGDTANSTLTLRTGADIISSNRIIITQFGVEFYENINMQNADILNVGGAGGDWMTNNLSIGSGDSTLTSEGHLLINASDEIQLRPDGINDIEIYDNTDTPVKYAWFDTSERDFIVSNDGINPIFHVDSSGDIHIYTDINLHSNNITGLGMSTGDSFPDGGAWIEDALQIGDDDSILSVAGDNSLSIQTNAINRLVITDIITLHGNLDLNGNSIIGLDAGNAFPAGGAWTTNYLRIGNGTSVLQAGDSSSDVLRIRTGGNSSSDNRVVISSDTITFLEDVNLSDNELTNVGGSGGEWVDGNLNIGTGDTTIGAGGNLLIWPDNELRLRPGDAQYDIEIVDDSAILYAYFDTSEQDFVITDNTNNIFHVDTSEETIFVRDSIYGGLNNDIGIVFGNSSLDIYSSSGGTAQEETMWFVDRNTDALYTINKTTGVTARVHPTNTMSISANALVWADDVLYTIDGAVLYTIDIETGLETRVHPTNTIGSNVGALAWDGTTIYAGADQDDSLYTVNKEDGTGTLVGSFAGPTTIGGLAWDGTALYLMVSRTLYTVDTTSGSATLVGTLAGAGAIRNLTWDGEFFYGVISGGSRNFYRITVSGNSVTGVTVTSLDSSLTNVRGMAYRPAVISESNKLLEIESDTVNVLGTLDLNNNEIVNAIGLGDSFPSEGAWTNNYLRIGNGDSVLQAGDNSTESLLISIGGNNVNTYVAGFFSNEVEFYQDIDMQNNDIRNVGNAGGDWTNNHLRIGDNTSILQAGESASNGLLIRTGGSSPTSNRIEISSNGITFSENINMTTGTISNVGNAGGDWTSNRISIGNDASTLTAGDTISLGVDLDLNGNSIIGLGDTGDSFPAGGAWTENYLRIGNGNSVLQAGDASGESLTIRTGGNLSANSRMIISGTEVDLFENLNLNNNDLLNVGDSGGDWTENSLQIGSGDSTLGSGGNLLINATDEIRIRPGGTNDIEIYDNSSTPVRYAWFDTSEQDFIVTDGTNSVLIVDTSAGDILIRDALTGVDDSDTGLRFVGSNVLNFYAGSLLDADARMDVQADQINMYQDLDMNNNQILNLDTSNLDVGDSFPTGGVWTENYLQIGTGASILYGGSSILFRTASNDFFGNRMSMNSVEVDFLIRVNMNNNDLLNVGNSGGDWTSNSLSIGNAASTLTAGGTISLGVDLDLNGNSIIGLGDTGGDSFPTGGTWTEDYLRVGIGNTVVLDAGDADTDEFRIRLNNIDRLSIEDDNVGFFTNISMESNSILNVANAGQWLSNNLRIGIGNSIITAGGTITLTTDNDIDIRRPFGNAIRAKFDSIGFDFLIYNSSGNSVFQVDSSEGTVQITNGYYHLSDTDTGIGFSANNNMEFYAGSDTSERMAITSSEVDLRVNINMNGNDVNNVGNSGGDWIANNLRIGTGDSLLRSGGNMRLRPGSSTSDIIIQDNSGVAYVTFDTSAQSMFIGGAGDTNQVFLANVPEEQIRIRDTIYGIHDPDTGIHWPGSDVLQFRAGSTSATRMDIMSNQINIYEDLDMNNNAILNSIFDLSDTLSASTSSIITVAHDSTNTTTTIDDKITFSTSAVPATLTSGTVYIQYEL